MECCETGLLEEAGCCPEERNQKLQSNSVDIGEGYVVCKLYLFAVGEGKQLEKWKNLHVTSTLP